MAGKRSKCSRRRSRKQHGGNIKRRSHRRRRRNQRGGLIPLPLMTLGAGLLAPIIADGVNDIVKRFGI